MVTKATQRARRAATVSRWSRRTGAPVSALILSDLALIVAWLLVLMGPPTLLPSASNLFFAVFDSLWVRAFGVCLIAWILALGLTSVISRKKLIWLGSAPRQFLLLGLAAVALFHLAGLLLPELPLPAPHAAALPPVALVGIVHWAGHLYTRYLRRGKVAGLLLGPASTASTLNAHINRYERLLGITIVGLMSWDDRVPNLVSPLPTRFDEIVEAMRDCGASVLVLTVGSITSMTDMQDLRWQLENEGLHLDIVIEPTCLGPGHVEISAAPGLALVRTAARHDTWPDAFLKRAFDLLASSFLILLLAPVWLVLAYLIRRQDGGPAFFLQERVGRGGITFPMVKFRTMVTNAEVVLEELREAERPRRAILDEDGPTTDVLFKLKRDPRVTPLGGFLRRSSVDELPQLFNVWLGHMSLVGPRPPLPREVAHYRPRVMRKFNVRPGMTGLWQVSGRSNLSWEESVKLDLYYVENRTLAFDLKILFMTIRAVLYQDGAY